MQLKKIALRGMIILAVVLVLCVLFSGTLRTLTTPKMRQATIKTGKIEKTNELEGEVVYPEKDEIPMRVPEGLSLTVTKVHVAVGDKVKAKDKLFSTEVTDLEAKLKTQQDSYDEARKTLDEWKRKNGEIRLSRNENLWIEAYDAARDAEKKELDARLSVMAEVNVTSIKKVTEELVHKKGEKAEKLYSEWQDAVKKMEEAQKKQADLDRYAVADDIWATLQTKRDAEKKQKEAENQMMKIRLLEKQYATILSPRDGYVVEIKAQKDSTLTGEADLLVMTPEGVEPVLRANTRDIKQTIQKGTVVSIPVDESGRRRVDTKVKATGYDETGNPYLDAEITEDVIRELGSVNALMKRGKIPMKLTTRTQQSTCLVPTSAVQGQGDERFVYVAREGRSLLVKPQVTVAKKEVTVLAETSEYVSIEEDLTFGWVVLYMADRPVEEGDAVIVEEVKK